MNAVHITVGPDLLIAAGTTVLCSPLVIDPARGRCRTNMKFWSIDLDQKFKSQGYTSEGRWYSYADQAIRITEPTTVVIMGPAPAPAPAPSLYPIANINEAWCYVLIHGELRLFKLCMTDIANENVKIIDDE